MQSILIVIATTFLASLSFHAAPSAPEQFIMALSAKGMGKDVREGTFRHEWRQNGNCNSIRDEDSRTALDACFNFTKPFFKYYVDVSGDLVKEFFADRKCTESIDKTAIKSKMNGVCFVDATGAHTYSW